MQRLHIISKRDANKASKINRKKRVRCPHTEGFKRLEPGVRECNKCGEVIRDIPRFTN